MMLINAMTDTTNIDLLLNKIYGAEKSDRLLNDIVKLIKDYSGKISGRQHVFFDQQDMVLITYGDMVQRENEPPLETLETFLSNYAADTINTVHLLPFFPYSSDDGFSVIDFKQVNPKLGEWHHIEKIGKKFSLMADLVLNHISAQSDWFQAFLRDEAPFNDFFITVENDVDLSKVVRPRALPLLTEFDTKKGRKKVWTTFSADQIDLNYQNPLVLLSMLDILLFYAHKGISIIRLDAVAYIWKQIGSTCIHLPQAHAIVQLMRAVLDEVAPWVKLITETNVPHKDNISYFSNGFNEAQMVYNFSLPPLMLHSFISQSATEIANWAETLDVPSEQTAFFNFLASHDGIGITPVKGILKDAQINTMIERVKSLNGRISYKKDSDGDDSPYEMNINFMDALDYPENADEDEDKIASRFITSQAIMLSLRGVPGVYFHSLVGSRGWQTGVTRQGYARAINREKLDFSILTRTLKNDNSLRAKVYHRYRNLLKQRRQHDAFHPQGSQHILKIDERIFGLVRTAPDNRQHVLCLHNISEYEKKLLINLHILKIGKVTGIRSLLGNIAATFSSQVCTLILEPYQTAWLEILGTHTY